MEKAAAQSPAPCTTFVQADAATFKELVQRLTGPHDESHHHSSPPSRPTEGQGPSPSSRLAGVKRPAFKLQERRQQLSRSKLTISKPNIGWNQGLIPSPPPHPSLLSPSAQLSNLMIGDKEAELNHEEEEEKAIKERRFYLHPSPPSRLKNAQPELLPLFPLSSTARNPRMPPL